MCDVVKLPESLLPCKSVPHHERGSVNIIIAVMAAGRLNAETANGYKWVDRPPSAVGGDQADHRKSMGAGGKRKRAESECPVKLVSTCVVSGWLLLQKAKGAAAAHQS